MADVHRVPEPDDQEGRTRFQVTQVLYLPEHHLKYKGNGLIKENCFLSVKDDDEVLALALSANLDEKVDEDETDMFKKLIAQGEKSSAKKLKSPPLFLADLLDA